MAVATDIIQRFLNGPDGRKIAAQIEAEKLEERKKLAAALAELTAEAEVRLPKLRQAAEAEQPKVEKARAALMAAQEAAARVYQAYSAASWEYDHKRGRLESALIETADPSIAEFVQELRDLYRETAAHGLETKDVGHTVSGHAVRTSNRESLLATLAAIRAATAVAQRLHLEPLDAAGLRKRFQGLRDSIPPVGPAPDRAA